MTRPELEAGAVVGLVLRYMETRQRRQDVEVEARQGLPVPLVHAILDESEASDALLALDPAQLRALAASLSQQQAEAEALREQVAAYERMSTPGFQFEAGVMDMTIQGGPVQRLALMFTAMFRDNGAQNFLEMEVHHGETRERFTVTVQRRGGETPTEQRNAARAELGRIQAISRGFKTDSRSVLRTYMELIHNMAKAAFAPAPAAAPADAQGEGA